MAEWAKWMLVATWCVGIGTIIVAALGAYWVKGTLDATRLMASHTRDIGKNQVRAYLDVAFAKMADDYDATTLESLGDGYEAVVTFTNSGNSPARCIYHRQKEKTIRVGKLDDLNFDVSDKDWKGPFDLSAGASYQKIIDNVLDGEDKIMLISGFAYTVIMGEVKYLDVFGDSQEVRYLLRIENYGTERARIFPYGPENYAT